MTETIFDSLSAIETQARRLDCLLRSALAWIEKLPPQPDEPARLAHNDAILLLDQAEEAHAALQQALAAAYQAARPRPARDS